VVITALPCSDDGQTISRKGAGLTRDVMFNYSSYCTRMVEDRIFIQDRQSRALRRGAGSTGQGVN